MFKKSGNYVNHIILLRGKPERCETRIEQQQGGVAEA
jgi:hypothetical protein